MDKKKQRDLSERQMEVIRSMAKNGMRLTDVATELYRHRNTVAYHVEAIKGITGKDPMIFSDLVSLLREIGEMPGEVNVVLCKGCKCSRPLDREDPFEKRFVDGCVWCKKWGEGMMPDDYCSYGKRKKGE